jgi:predicted lipoprotein with Yx(FWY)xxD motif
MATNKLTRTNTDSLLLAGSRKHFAKSASLQFGGSAHAPAEIEAALVRRVAAASDTGIARTAFHGAVAAERTARTETNKLVLQFRAFVLATFGEDLAALADFGLAPRKQRPLKPPVQVAAAAKAKATRAARGTKGKKQKQAIKVAAPAPATPAPATTTAK